MFAFEKADGPYNYILRGAHDGSPNVQHDEFSGGATVESQLGGSEGFNSHISGLAITAPFRESELLEVKGNFQKVDCVGDVNLFQVRLYVFMIHGSPLLGEVPV